MRQVNVAVRLRERDRRHPRIDVVFFGVVVAYVDITIITRPGSLRVAHPLAVEIS